MPYWKLFYHVVWATRFRERVIHPEIEPVIHDLLAPPPGDESPG